MLDPTEFGKAMAVIVKEATAPLAKRIEELEARLPEKGDKGERGEKGEAGEPGRDAQPADIEAAVSKYLEANPLPRGERGEKGEPGQDAEPVDIAEVAKHLLASDGIRALVNIEAAAYLQENPPADGKDGAAGKDGRDGERGEKGEKGESGADGKDGAGIADLLIDRDGVLTATFTDGRMKSLGRIIGKDGEPGKDGADFTDCELDWDGERTLVIRGKGGEIRKTIPVPMDRGYWQDGEAAEKGDIKTHDGNAWIALRDTKAKPCHANKDDWRLFARKGRDGRDLRDAPEPGTVKLRT
jgi:integrin beta 3